MDIVNAGFFALKLPNSSHIIMIKVQTVILV